VLSTNCHRAAEPCQCQSHSTVPEKAAGVGLLQLGLGSSAGLLSAAAAPRRADSPLSRRCPEIKALGANDAAVRPSGDRHDGTLFYGMLWRGAPRRI